MIWRLGRSVIYFLYGLDVEVWPKSGVPHHPLALFIHLGGAIGSYKANASMSCMHINNDHAIRTWDTATRQNEFITYCLTSGG